MSFNVLYNIHVTCRCALRLHVDTFCSEQSSTSGICTCIVRPSFLGGSCSLDCSRAGRNHRWLSTSILDLKNCVSFRYLITILIWFMFYFIARPSVSAEWSGFRVILAVIGRTIQVDQISVRVGLVSWATRHQVAARAWMRCSRLHLCCAIKFLFQLFADL